MKIKKTDINKKNTGINWGQYYYRFGLSKKKYYIIRRGDSKAGLFSLVNTNLGHIYYAIEKGYIPVIDMQNYENCYLEPEQIGRINAWEYFFEQPVGVSLEEAYNGNCVIMGNGAPNDTRPDDDMDFFNNVNGKMEVWRNFAHKYLRINARILVDINNEYNDIANASDRILGVLVRGTDYLEKKPYQHPVQPNPIDVIEKCDKAMKEWECNKIFVATEDKTIADKFKEKFGDAYITNNREFVNYESGKGIPECHANRENDFFLQGKEYLTSMVMLSRCNCFIAGRTSGSVGVMMLTDGFENQYIYNLGRYGIEGANN